MKKYILILVVFILVVAVVGIARSNPVWASMLPAFIRSGGAAQSAAIGVPIPPAKIITVNGSGIYNVGGVCTIEVDFKVPELQVVADAEVPLIESQKVPFSGEGNLLFPGCHFVFYKQNVIVSPLASADGSSKVCFGATPELQMTIHYYLDTPEGGSRAWIPLPTTLEDDGKLVCAPAVYSGVYMPAGKLVPQPGSEQAGSNPLFPEGVGGSVLPPPSDVTITESGTYAVGGICLITAEYKITGLEDEVNVEYPTEDTLKVPSEDVEGLFYFPGCHVLHYRDQEIKDTMTREEGDWQICFAAIPGKTMTIYYYRDDLTEITPPWIALATTTENGMACADLVDFTAVYAPAGK